MPFVPDQPETRRDTGFIPDLPPPIPPPWPTGLAPKTVGAAPTLPQPQVQPLPPPGTPGPGEPPSGLPVITSPMIERTRAESVQPAPYMQAALEGAGIGAMAGGLPAAARVAAEMAAGTKAAEIAEPHIERAIPGQDPISAISRWVLEQGAFMLPGMGAEMGAEAIRRMPPRVVPEQLPDIAVKGPLPGIVEPPPKPVTQGLPSILPEGGRVQELPTASILSDPETFQYKSDVNVQGITEKFKETRKFDKNLAGILSVWKDPASGNTYVVNGHHRLELAQRLGEPSMTVRFIDAATPKEARTVGALINIAEGQGTSLDAAKLFRDSGFTRDSLENIGISMSSKQAREGLGLAKLTPELFRQVTIGEIKPAAGAVIGNNLPDPVHQTGLLRLLLERRAQGKSELSDRELEHLTRTVQGATATGKEQTTLFGTEQMQQNLAVEKSQLASFIDEELGKSASAMSYVSKRKREIEKAKGNVINETLSASIAKAASQGRETFMKFAHTPGPISDILNDGARRLARGEDVQKVKRDTFIAVQEALRTIIPGGAGEGLAGVAAPPEPPQAGLFGSQRGAFVLPEIITKPVAAVHDAGVWVGKGIAPTAFATDDALNAVFGKRGEWIEADRFLYNQMSRGNEAFWDRVIGQGGIDDVKAFMGRLSRGEKQPTEDMQKLADFYRKADDAAALGASQFREVPYLEHHFPGLFTKPDEAEAWFQSRGRRPMEGTKGFFNKKKWLDFEEAVKPKELGGGGLEPISWNPEVLWRTYLEDVRKFTAARSWFEDRKSSGHLTWRPQGAPMPKGKAAINDQITKRYFPPDAVPVVFKRENLQAALRKYVQTLTRLSQRVSETTRTETTGSTTAEGKPTNVGKIEARVREALIHRGFSTGETEQFIGRLKSAGAAGADAAKEVVREITERIKTIERATAEVMNLPPEVTLKGRVATQKFIPAGEWVMDENEARVINNIFSQDFIRSNPGLRGILLMNTKMNALQLGFSAFHITNEFGNAWGTKMGQVAGALARGKPLRALGQLARVPTAPIEYLLKGHRYWNDPAMTFDVMSPIRHGLQLTKPTGAFAPGTAMEAFMRSVRRREPGGALVNFPGAVVDALMAPIFQYGVPRMKVGAYLDVLADEMDRNAAGIAEGRIDPKTLARRVVEQIDNRMGMVNYDLWAWNRTLKTGIQLIFRAPGWNFGYGKAAVQGMADIARGRFTPAAQFVVGTALATATGSEIYQFLHTGKHIENVTDILFPRNGKVDENGNELRVRFPGPLKDAWGLSNDLVGTVFNKMSPGLNMVWRAFAPESFGGNKDFFGDYIRNRADPWPVQGQQLLEWVARELTPFSFQQYGKIHGASPEQKPLTEAEMEAYAGFTKAPREVIEGPEGQALSTLLKQHTRPMGPRTPEQKSMDERKRQAQEEIRAGGPRPTLDALRKEGAFPTAQALRQFILNAQRTGRQKMLRRLPKRFRPAELPPLGPTP